MAYLNNSYFEFCYARFTKMPFYFFYTEGQKNQK